MGQLVLNDALLARLGDDARARGVAPEVRAAQIIEQALARTSRRAELLREVDRIASMTPAGVLQTPSELLIREDRDREP